ncbi:I78 family peptidase inhibitor [Halomonas sp. Bachu 37]|uniref:I78 family peptidase inhibitor n=1 Tax=Halomonas kashgarensis TaxID=3084920 RepID=UPI0032170BC8
MLSKRRILLTLTSSALLAGCVGTGDAQVQKDASQDLPIKGMHGNCDAAKVEHYVGRIYDNAMEPALLSASGADRLRVKRPGYMHTADDRHDRLNVELDQQGVITDVTCG